MTQFLTFLFVISFCLSGFSQSLNNYSYVVVPNRFEIQSESNQYKLNEMAQFYFEKNGFNAFMSNENLNAPRCDGLYADVEEKKLFIGTGLEIILRDCNDDEVYRSHVGRSKYKEFDKAYQDALRKAFRSFETLKVKQRDVEFHTDLSETEAQTPKPNREPDLAGTYDSKITETKGEWNEGLPTATYTRYSSNGDSFLLQKTGEGYSLYYVNHSEEDQLELIGKIIVMDALIKFMDMDGKVSDAVFETNGTLTISKTVYKKAAN